jgi:hypothetical protein
MVAMAIFAGAALVLVALFPVAHRTEQQSERETRSTLIAESIMEALPISPESGSLRVATGMTNGEPAWKFIDPKKPSTIALCYDESCEPLYQFEPSTLTKPIPDPKVAAIAIVTLTPKPATPGMIHAEVSVAAPAAAPADHRTTNHFSRLLVLP